jgi:hypothetical protein
LVGDKLIRFNRSDFRRVDGGPSEVEANIQACDGMGESTDGNHVYARFGD